MYKVMDIAPATRNACERLIKLFEAQDKEGIRDLLANAEDLGADQIYLADTLFRLGFTRTALALYKKFDPLDPDAPYRTNLQIKDRIGVCYYKAQETQQASRYIEDTADEPFLVFQYPLRDCDLSACMKRKSDFLKMLKKEQKHIHGLPEGNDVCTDFTLSECHGFELYIFPALEQLRYSGHPDAVKDLVADLHKRFPNDHGLMRYIGIAYEHMGWAQRARNIDLWFKSQKEKTIDGKNVQFMFRHAGEWYERAFPGYEAALHAELAGLPQYMRPQTYIDRNPRETIMNQDVEDLYSIIEKMKRYIADQKQAETVVDASARKTVLMGTSPEIAALRNQFRPGLD